MTDLRSMPEEMPTLHKRAIFFMDMGDGGYQQGWECVEYPQISFSVSALTGKTKPVRVFHVLGVEGDFTNIRDAYRALRNLTALREVR